MLYREDGTAMCCRERRPCITSSIRSASGQAALQRSKRVGMLQLGYRRLKQQHFTCKKSCESTIPQLRTEGEPEGEPEDNVMQLKMERAKTVSNDAHLSK
ncbi:hypothetical protein CDV31_007712 [Fusarium ambrosium]|uniref:Uncharacterized protein n=1 Tax=Fusarium ambrosium TaxID=131363 RepID=A0A428U5A7_9HYPO|nr:hypothetical protein CDV31_007712 [Fusarium ambrosium]